MTDSSLPSSTAQSSSVWGPLLPQQMNQQLLDQIAAMPKPVPHVVSPLQAFAPQRAPQQMGRAQGGGGGGGFNALAGGTYHGGGQGETQLRDAAYKAGFRGQALETAVAIGMAESGGNPGEINNNPGTGDLSYGDWQINMLGGMGPQRRAQYGLSSNDQLLDPYVNARVAYQMSGGGQNWQPWSTYKGGQYRQFMDPSIANYQGG